MKREFRLKDNGNGHFQIEAKVNLKRSDEGEIFAPVVEIPKFHRPTLSYDDDGNVFATVSYETWTQFPSDINEAQKDFVELLKTIISTEAV